MPETLARAVYQFADDVGRLNTPLAVLVALQNVSHCTGVEVLGAWALPRYFKDEITDWREGENLFFHPDVPRSFWPEYLKQFAEYGYSTLRRGEPPSRSLSLRLCATNPPAKLTGYSASCAAITSAMVCIVPIARGQSSSFRLSYWRCD